MVIIRIKKLLKSILTVNLRPLQDQVNEKKTNLKLVDITQLLFSLGTLTPYTLQKISFTHRVSVYRAVDCQISISSLTFSSEHQVPSSHLQLEIAYQCHITRAFIISVRNGLDRSLQRLFKDDSLSQPQQRNLRFLAGSE